MKDEDYIPTMIQDPHTNVLNSDSWAKEVDKYKIYTINK